MFNLQSVPVLLAVLCLVWMLIKNFAEIRKNSEKKCHLMGFILFFIMFYPMFPCLLALVATSWIVRSVVEKMLRMRFGDNFFEMVKHIDVFNSIYKIEYSHIHVMSIMECDIEDDIFELTKSMVRKFQDRYENELVKLYCSLNEWLGFLYYKKVKASVDDYVLKLPVSNTMEELDKTELTRLLSDSYYRPLPLNNTMLWDIQVGTQPLKCKNNKKNYPILIRLHHTLGEGVVLAQLLITIFSDGTVPSFSGALNIKNSLKKKAWYLRLMQSTAMSLELFCMLPSLVYLSVILRRPDENNLFGKPLVKKEVLAYDNDEEAEYFKKVKIIKNKLSQTSFSEIVTTAFSASLQDCLQKHTTSTPSHIISVLTTMANFKVLLDAASEQKKYNKLNLTNQFASLQLNLPVFIETHKDYVKEYPLTSRLKIVKKCYRNVRTLTEILYKANVLPLVTVFPAPFLRVLFKTVPFNSVCSIVPGPLKFVFHEERISVSNSIFWIPHLLDTDINFAVFTVNSQLQLGVNANANLGLDDEAVSDIVKNTYKNLDLLDKEIDGYVLT